MTWFGYVLVAFCIFTTVLGLFYIAYGISDIIKKKKNAKIRQAKRVQK